MSNRSSAILLALAACTSTVDTIETEQGLSCEYQHRPCNPYDINSEWECTYACGYTAHCRDYTYREYQLCADHPGEVVSLAPYRRCNNWGNPSWNTWCEPVFVARSPGRLARASDVVGDKPRACEPSDTVCYPRDPLARYTCRHACEQPSHCEDYGPGDYAYCEANPGAGGKRRCTMDGFPSWASHCTSEP